MTRPAEGPGTPLEPPGNRWPRWMAIQDRIRLTGLLPEKASETGLFLCQHVVELTLGTGRPRRPSGSRTEPPFSILIRPWLPTGRAGGWARTRSARASGLPSPHGARRSARTQLDVWPKAAPPEHGVEGDGVAGRDLGADDPGPLVDRRRCVWSVCLLLAAERGPHPGEAVRPGTGEARRVGRAAPVAERVPRGDVGAWSCVDPGACRGLGPPDWPAALRAPGESSPRRRSRAGYGSRTTAETPEPARQS